MPVDTLLSRGWSHCGLIGSFGTATNHIVDASTEGIAFVFQPHTADPITHLGYRYGARAGTPPTYLIRLEGLDSGGLPDNTDVGGGSATAVTFTPPADASIDGLWQWRTLTNAYTPTRGQQLAAVIRYSSGTIDGSNNSSFTRNVTQFGGSRDYPYAVTNTGGTWSKVTANSIFGYRTASGRYGMIAQASYTTATANTAGHQSGMYFTNPSGLGSTYQIIGLAFVGDMGAAAGSAKLSILSTDGTVRQTVTIDADHYAAAPGNGNVHNPIYFADTNLYDFAYGTKYYAVIEVVSGAVGMNGVTLAEAADRSAYPNGVNRGLVTYNGSYTETDTVMPLCELILSNVTLPAAGGGSGMILGGSVVY